MAIDKQGLRNLFGNADEDEKKEDFFSEDSDTEDSPFEFFTEEDDDLLPAAPVIRDKEALPITQQNINSDVKYALDTQNDLINQAQRLIQIALENASNGGTARDIEVASNAITNAAKVVEGLMSLHEKRTKLNGGSQPEMGSGNTFVQNQIVYQGTTSEAMKALRDGTLDIDKM
jgi:hypothetical protein